MRGDDSMGYMYDMMKVALGGSSFANSHSGVVKNWSPNNIKALIITEYQIITINHVSLPKVTNLDYRKAYDDIVRNGSTGSLHNLLTQRQLSCLEEIYVSGVFQNYLGCMDINAYINKMLTDSCRLRYYGYINVSNYDEIVRCYSNAKEKGNPLYAYALDRGRTNSIQYNSVGNEEWYKNYRLRPQYYAMDADNANLARWLKRAEKVIEDGLATHERMIRLSEKNNSLYKLFLKDVERVPDLRTLMRLSKYTGRYKSDETLSAVHRVIVNRLNESFCLDNLTVRDLQDSVQSHTMSVTEEDKYVLAAYKNLGVFDTDSKKNEEVSMDLLREYVMKDDGLLQLTRVLEDICCNLIRTNKQVKMMLKVNSIRFQNDLPDGDFKKLMSLSGSNGRANYKGFLKILLAVCGTDYDTFNSMYNNLWSM